jgi:hypothetical protein
VEGLIEAIRRIVTDRGGEGTPEGTNRRWEFEQLPTATTVEAIEALLPWNLKPVLTIVGRPGAALAPA